MLEFSIVKVIIAVDKESLSQIMLRFLMGVLITKVMVSATYSKSSTSALTLE